MHMCLYDECCSYISSYEYCSEYEIIYNNVKILAIWLPTQQTLSPKERSKAYIA